MNTGEVDHNAVLGGAAGGVFWAMVQVFTLVSAPTPPSHRTIASTLLGSAFAVISGLWGSKYIAPLICQRTNITLVDMVTLVGFAVGATFWIGAQGAIRVIIAFIPALTKAVLERVTGVKAT